MTGKFATALTVVTVTATALAGLWALALLLDPQPATPVALLLAAVLVAVSAVLLRGGDKRRRDKAAYLARADYEHQELCRGNEWVGMFGQYPPPRI